MASTSQVSSVVAKLISGSAAGIFGFWWALQSTGLAVFFYIIVLVCRRFSLYSCKEDGGNGKTIAQVEGSAKLTLLFGAYINKWHWPRFVTAGEVPGLLPIL